MKARIICLTAALALVAQTNADSFSSYKQGNFTSLETPNGIISAETGNAAIDKKSVDTAPGSLRLLGGENKSFTITLSDKLRRAELLHLTFQGERWTRAAPFEFSVEAKQDGRWKQIYDGNGLRAGGFSEPIKIDLKHKRYEAFRFTSTTKDGSGVLIDNLRVGENKSMAITGVEVKQHQIPALIAKEHNVLLHITINAEGARNVDTLEALQFITDGTTDLDDVEAFSLYSTGNSSTFETIGNPPVDAPKVGEELVFQQEVPLVDGPNHLWLVAQLKDDAKLSHRVDATLTKLKFARAGIVAPPNTANDITQRIGYNVVTGGQSLTRPDGSQMPCRLVRIPGMVTTNNGTLLAVYDMRWKQGGDLPGDIDVGLSASTTGGQSWLPARPIVDMKTWGDQPENKNGAGDPAILVDRKTGHIYCLALWAHGLSSGWYWGISKPGLDPKDTGQVVMVKSEDDGATWSEPVNITKQIKDPAWSLLLQGPGAGISMRDGTLVFAGQFQEPSNGRKARSTIIYSKDHGKTWQIGTGVPHDQETTEAQVVELDDGSLMLNCRISAGGRAVYTTKDLGKTWTKHPTTGSHVFNMTGCMASILRYSSVKDGDDQSILLFSGPVDGGKKRRTHMSVRYSLDEGETWSAPYLLDELGGAYSCLTLIGDGPKKDIGIIYEGSQSNMCFERLTIDELMNATK